MYPGKQVHLETKIKKQTLFKMNRLLKYFLNFFFLREVIYARYWNANASVETGCVCARVHKDAAVRCSIASGASANVRVDEFSANATVSARR